MKYLFLFVLLVGCQAGVVDPKQQTKPVYYWAPYNKGVEDFDRGVPLELSPYRNSHMGYLSAWQDGWLDARDGKPLHYGS